MEPKSVEVYHSQSGLYSQSKPIHARTFAISCFQSAKSLRDTQEWLKIGSLLTGFIRAEKGIEKVKAHLNSRIHAPSECTKKSPFQK